MRHHLPQKVLHSKGGSHKDTLLCTPLLWDTPQVHVHTDHESPRYLKTCPRPLTPRQARWSQFLEEYNLTLWYVPGLENPAADACSRLTSQ